MGLRDPHRKPGHFQRHRLRLHERALVALSPDRCL